MNPNFVASNAHPTISHSICCLCLPCSSGTEWTTRSLYEVNLWMWQPEYGMEQERKMSVCKCMEARVKRLHEARGRAAEMRKRNRLAAEELGGQGIASP